MTRGARLDTCDKEGSQAIHVAAMLGHTDILAYLIAKGQSVDTKDASGRTPLMLGKHQEEDHSQMTPESHIVTHFSCVQGREPGDCAAAGEDGGECDQP